MNDNLEQALYKANEDTGSNRSMEVAFAASGQRKGEKLLCIILYNMYLNW